MTHKRIGPHLTSLHALLDQAQCLLLDFDGPVCRLFYGLPAHRVAARMREHLSRHGIDLDDLAGSLDPHRILCAAMPRQRAAELEEMLADEEELAARSAQPTPDAAEFIQAAAGGGKLLAITTNNAPSAVAAYLKEHGLDGYFGPHIFGRGDDPALMKPHPDCLLRAMAALDMAPRDCLMIGDSPPDAAAAMTAGVGFLGYARSPDRVARLRTLGPHPVVVGMRDLVAAARSLEPPSG